MGKYIYIYRKNSIKHQVVVVNIDEICLTTKLTN